MKLNALKNLFVLFALFIISVISSCKKDITIDENDISNAQQWYNKNSQSVRKFIHLEGKDLVPIIETPIWAEARKTLLENGTLVIAVPVKSNLFTALGQNGGLQLVMEKKRGYYHTRYIGNTKANMADKSVSELYRMAFTNGDN